MEFKGAMCYISPPLSTSVHRREYQKKRLRSPTCSSFDHLHRSAPDQVSYMKGGRDTCTNVHPWPVLLRKQEDREGLESKDRGCVMWCSEMKEHPWRFTKIAYWHFRLNILHESFVTSPFSPSWVSVSLDWTGWKLVKIFTPKYLLVFALFCVQMFVYQYEQFKPANPPPQFTQNNSYSCVIFNVWDNVHRYQLFEASVAWTHPVCQPLLPHQLLITLQNILAERLPICCQLPTWRPLPLTNSTYKTIEIPAVQNLTSAYTAQ